MRRKLRSDGEKPPADSPVERDGSRSRASNVEGPAQAEGSARNPWALTVDQNRLQAAQLENIRLRKILTDMLLESEELRENLVRSRPKRPAV